MCDVYHKFSVMSLLRNLKLSTCSASAPNTLLILIKYPFNIFYGSCVCSSKPLWNVGPIPMKVADCKQYVLHFVLCWEPMMPVPGTAGRAGSPSTPNPPLAPKLSRHFPLHMSFLMPRSHAHVPGQMRRSGWKARTGQGVTDTVHWHHLNSGDIWTIICVGQKSVHIVKKKLTLTV